MTDITIFDKLYKAKFYLAKCRFEISRKKADGLFELTSKLREHCHKTECKEGCPFYNRECMFGIKPVDWKTSDYYHDYMTRLEDEIREEIEREMDCED